MAFYLTFKHKTKDKTEDLYPRIKQVIEENRVPSWNAVRYTILKHFGYFVTESSEHFSEYVPWFIKRDRPDLISRYNIPLDEYITRCEMQNALFDIIKGKLKNPRGTAEEAVDEIIKMIEDSYGKVQIRGLDRFLREIFDIKPSSEYAPLIIHGMETGTAYEVYGNTENKGLIENLPADCAVEVPCLVNQNGIRPIRIGRLPLPLASLMQTNINVQALTVEAALTQKRDAIYQAAMLDPHTAAELDMDQIHDLVDDLIEAHGPWLPKYY